METREQAIEFLFGRINYERASGGSYTAGCFKLERMGRFLELLGDPQQRLPAVHIAGTKGKGSTAVMVAEMLSSAGYRTGLFTSPHIHQFEERMRVDGASPVEQEFVTLANEIAPAVAELDGSAEGMQPTYFEIATAMAWLYFVRCEADVVVLEVGLGGRLDATNLCAPVATLITNISYDHTAVLGKTLAKIAAEKAGIVKRGVPVISGVDADEARAVVHAACRSHDAPLYELDQDIFLQGRRQNSDGQENGPIDRGQWVDVDTAWRRWPAVWLPLMGEHQARNLALALATVDLLNEGGRAVEADAARRGLSRVSWPLRIEILSERPTVVVDAAHNVESVRALLRTLREEFSGSPRTLVFAATRDKSYGDMLRELAPWFDTIVLTNYVGNPRGVPVEQLAAVCREQCGREAQIAIDPRSACAAAVSGASPDELICVTGSFFLAAETRAILGGSRNSVEPLVTGPSTGGG